MTSTDIGTGVRVTVRFFAAARAAVGADEAAVDLPTPATVRSLTVALTTRYGPELGRVLERCSFLLDEVVVQDPATTVPDGSAVDVLPPFAGG